MSGDLNGKVAVVTGAGSGIGRATSLRFAKAGARVVANDKSNGVLETAAMIERVGGVCTTAVSDAGSEPDVRELVAQAIRQFGAIDIFHANAGITGTAEIGIFDSNPADWLEVLRVNLIGPFLAIKHAAPSMILGAGGSIICTSSVAGLRAGAGPAAYSASKAGVISLVQSACLNLSGTNVRVNAICPGLVVTPMTRHWCEPAGLPVKELTEIIPQRRGAEAEEIASVALFLASEAARYINGQCIVIDGGLTALLPSPRPLSVERPPNQATAPT